MAGIGHNSGQELGRGWQRYSWKRARRDLVGATVPVEVVRTRIRRARELGLEYPQYASILMGSGRDIVGFLFTVDGLQLRLQRRLDMPDRVRDKLQVVRSKLISFAPSGENPDAFRQELNDVSGVAFAAAAPELADETSWSAARQAVRAALDPLELPGSAVVLIGAKDSDAQMVVAGKMAKFIPTDAYFPSVGVQRGS